MTGSNAGQPVEGQLAQRLSAPRAGAETVRVRAATLLRRLDSYDRSAYRSVAQLRIPLLVNQPMKLAGETTGPTRLVTPLGGLLGGIVGLILAVIAADAIGRLRPPSVGRFHRRSRRPC
jgi:hypothetical protein